MKTLTAALLALGLLWPLSVMAAQTVPARGMTMAEVKAEFGAPQRVQPAVGQPPITRWHYDGYTVYFEGNLCLHTVTGQRHTSAPAAHTGEPSASEPPAPAAATAAPPAPGLPKATAAPEANDPDPSRPEPAESATPAESAESAESVTTADDTAAAGPRTVLQPDNDSDDLRFDPATGRLKIVEGADSHQHREGDTAATPPADDTDTDTDTTGS